MSEPKLRATTLNDVRSRTIANVMEDMRARLQTLREENDTGDAEITAKRRGRIAEVKEWLALLEQARSSVDADMKLSPSASSQQWQ